MQKIYTCLIADDSMPDRDAVVMFVGKISNLRIVAICSDGLEAASAIQENDIDIVFSDIDMPGLSGLELKQSLQQAPVFIYISSYAEHAAESYNLDIVDFIVKPISLARLIKAANKAIEYIELKKNAITNTAIHTTEPPPNTADHFFIKEDSGYSRINTADLLFIESMGNFSRLQTINKKHIALISLKNLSAQLPASQFVRVHKQYIVNQQHIHSITTEGEIKLTGEHLVPIGSSYKTNLMELVNRNILLR